MSTTPAQTPPDLFPYETGSSVTGPTPRRRWVLPLVTGVVGVLVGALGTAGITGARAAADERAEAAAAAAAEAAREVVLTDALDLCGVSSSAAGVDLGDDGTTLTIDNKGDDDYVGVSDTDLFCIIAALDPPSAVTSHMGQTTSMDGRQTETWDGITAAWSYHPDRGMDSVFTVE